MNDATHEPRRRWRPASLPAAWAALVVACLSMTPSLLPRPGVYQGVVTGITSVIAYGLGVLVVRLVRELAERDARAPRPLWWRLFGVVAVVALVGSALIGLRWQNEMSDLVGVAGPGLGWWALLPVAALLFAAFLGLGRVLAVGYRAIARLLSRVMGRRASHAIGLVTVAAATWFVVSGLLLSTAVRVTDEAFSIRNDVTPDGVVQPTTDLRSGGADSLVDWDTLGREGRVFAAGGPSAEQITDFTGTDALEPIRTYAGLDSADDVQDRARLAVDDLDRAGGFDRGYLLVATTTGSGWVESSAVDSLEYIAGGDTAIVAMQYSYLPSWISYLVDQERAREAGRALFDAVYERWLELPVADRPQLLVFGESLGSFGAESAFSGAQDLANRTDGALLVGPPGFNPLFSDFSAARDAGSPAVEPVLRDGQIVRFTTRVTERVEPVGAPWDGTRVLYLLHPSDPIIWWSPDLLFGRPDWLDEPRGDGVLDAMVWMPVVTFWQVTADLPRGMAVPPGTGHAYAGEHVDGWVAVLQPDGWTDAKTAELRAIVLGGR